MRILSTLAIVIALSVGTARGQETTTAAPAQIPASTCPAFVPTPIAPNGSRATDEQMNAAVAGYQAWQATAQATADCRNAERRAIDAQLQARGAELDAAVAANQAGAAAFQAQLDAYHARQERRR